MSDFYVSVIIPTYNRAYCLKRAIDSVLAQSFINWELIIIDDASTDNTHDVVKAYNDLRIKYIKLKQNKGVSHARNQGIKLSQFKWIALLDSDDVWLPQKLEKQLLLIKNQPELKFVHCNEIWIRNEKRINPHKKHQKYGGRIYFHCLPLCCVSPSASLIFHELFDQEGVFNENYPVCEDYDLWLRFFCKYEAGFVNELLLTKYGGNKDQLSIKYIAMDYWRVKSLVFILKNNKEYLTSEEVKATKTEINKKCKILLKGYEKHQNYVHYDEILSYLKILDEA
ncbi:MAG: glycosyltransferase [Bdellovibrionaceae bacterium]|nr:glycosyltransferase [Pseudobdellovibrionaceae bacterium]